MNDIRDLELHTGGLPTSNTIVAGRPTEVDIRPSCIHGDEDSIADDHQESQKHAEITHADHLLLYAENETDSALISQYNVSCN
ncbi:hypothetical protein H6P81_011858 [Aristolochia fimbriata]|uniref:Uncharacterized protein n=1 Tax=Aristolochia fimbriata TaxID=158543 RepID=A0AAV7EA48_ARIFI|nr:hypothetical protein H6P81_011858 [Aristolochia fimbriata]